MKKPAKFTVLALAISIALLGGCATTLPVADVKRIVVFGDSNVDNGNLYRMTNQQFPAAPRWKGRDSNGPVVVEYLAEALNAKLDNLAVSGATSGQSNIVPLIVPKYANVEKTGVAWQLDKFSEGGGKLDGSDLVVVWAGSNDIFGAKRENKEALAKRIEGAAQNLESTLLRLHALGAKKVLFATRTPREVIGNENDLNGVDLNAALLKTVKDVASRTRLDIRVYDSYARIADMMTNPARHGFTETRLLCVNVPACASENFDQGLKVANTFVNWDGAHKTTQVHKLMAVEIKELIAK